MGEQRRQNRWNKTLLVPLLLTVPIVLIVCLQGKTLFKLDTGLSATQRLGLSFSFYAPKCTDGDCRVEKDNFNQQDSGKDKEGVVADIPGDDVDWYAKHEEHGVNVRRSLREWRQSHAHRVISLQKGEHVLDFASIVRTFKEIMSTRGLVFMGDSTTRILYGALWCLLDGLPNPLQCAERQQFLKDRCRIEVSSRCNPRATFRNSGFNGSLEFFPHYKFGRFRIPNAKEHIEVTPDKIFFAGIPCLHSLWSPGSRETRVNSTCQVWPQVMREYYDELTDLVPTNQVYLNMPITITESKRGAELKVVNWYLQGVPFDPEDPRSIEVYEFYTLQRTYNLIPPNFAGQIPVQRSENQNHKCDSALFDDIGVKTCTLLAAELAPKDLVFVDMQSATEDASKDTDDGFHYNRGFTLRKMLTLLLKVILTNS